MDASIKKQQLAELVRIGEETKEFDYIPSRYLQRREDSAVSAINRSSRERSG